MGLEGWKDDDDDDHPVVYLLIWAQYGNGWL